MDDESIFWASKEACDKFVNEKNSPVKTIGFIYDENPDY